MSERVTNPDRLTLGEKNAVIRWIMYRLPMEQRHAMMTEMPYHYAKLTGCTPDTWGIDLVESIKRRIS